MKLPIYACKLIIFPTMSTIIPKVIVIIPGLAEPDLNMSTTLCIRRSTTRVFTLPFSSERSTFYVQRNSLLMNMFLGFLSAFG